MAYGVTGASGHLGRLAVQHLIKHGAAPKDVVALVRDPSKVSDLAAQGVRVATLDYMAPAADQTRAIREAGVTRLLLVSSSDILHDRAAQHRAVIAAAKSAGVEFLAYTSLLRATETAAPLANDHKATEQALRDSGLAFAVLRNGWYMENTIGEAAGRGAVTSCAAVPSLTPAARTDFAEAAAIVLTKGPAVYGGAVLELAGDEEVTLPHIAEAVGKKLGKTVPFHKVTPAEARAGLSQALPAPLPDILAASDEALGRGELTDKSGTLRKILGRPTTTLSQAIDAFFAK
eukprot:m51a1_g6363 hypothetical protein (289) ;mRNA; r:110783-111649